MVLTYQLDIHEESLLLHPNSLGSTEMSLGICKTTQHNYEDSKYIPDSWNSCWQQSNASLRQVNGVGRKYI